MNIFPTMTPELQRLLEWALELLKEAVEIAIDSDEPGSDFIQRAILWQEDANEALRR